MKREILSLSFLGILIIFLTVNIFTLKSLSDEIMSHSENILELSEKGNWDEAEKRINDLKDIWEEKEGYVKIVLKHSEIDEITTRILCVYEEILSRDINEVKSSTKLLSTYLCSTISSELPSWSSVL